MKQVVLFKSASEDYEKVFNNINFEVTFVEPLQFEYINSIELNEKLQEKHYSGLILTSPRAVEAVAKCWDPAKFVIWNTKRIYTVGETSGRKIKCLLGLEAIGTTSGNADNLAQTIIRENSDKNVYLFPCGNLRSESLPNTLQSSGITVDTLTVYETKENIHLKTDLMALESGGRPCCMAFFSPSGCEYIHRQLQTFGNELATLPHFAIGDSTAHKIENLGVEIAGVADEPRAESLAESVQKYFVKLKHIA